VTAAVHSAQTALWKAVAEQAAVWSALPVVRRFAVHLPRNASQRSHGLSGLLQHVEASGGMVASRPLRLGTNVPLMLSVMPGGAPTVRPQVLQPWLNDANHVEGAHRITVAWLRSRLPGYPLLPAPQLAPGTPLTTDEYTYRLPWTRDELAAGFQYQNPPSQAIELLGASAREVARADEAARRVAVGLLETAAWQRLRDAHTALSPAARTELVAARKAIAEAARPALVDAHEPVLAIPRDAYRQQVLSDVLGTLDGAALEYAEAFDGAERLLELAASDVFGQLAVYRPIVLTGVTDLAARDAETGTVELTVEDIAHLDLGSLAWVDDPLCPDAVHLTGLNYSFDQAAGTRVRIIGQVLDGTAAAWPRPDS